MFVGEAFVRKLSDRVVTSETGKWGRQFDVRSGEPRDKFGRFCLPPSRQHNVTKRPSLFEDGSSLQEHEGLEDFIRGKFTIKADAYTKLTFQIDRQGGDWNGVRVEKDGTHKEN